MTFAKLAGWIQNERFQNSVLFLMAVLFIAGGGLAGYAIAHHPSILSMLGLGFLTMIGAAYIAMGNDTGYDYFGNPRGHPLEAVFGVCLLLAVWGTLLYNLLPAAK